MKKLSEEIKELRKLQRRQKRERDAKRERETASAINAQKIRHNQRVRKASRT